MLDGGVLLPVLMMASPRASVPPPCTFSVKAPLTNSPPLVTVSVTPGLMISVSVGPGDQSAR